MSHDAKMMAELAAETPARPTLIANVSRRTILGGLGAFVLAVNLRDARADEGQTAEQKAQKFGADGMPHGWARRPQDLRRDRGRRPRDGD